MQFLVSPPSQIVHPAKHPRNSLSTEEGEPGAKPFNAALPPSESQMLLMLKRFAHLYWQLFAPPEARRALIWARRSILDVSAEAAAAPRVRRAAVSFMVCVFACVFVSREGVDGGVDWMICSNKRRRW